MKEIMYIGGFCLPNKNAAAQRVISNSKIFRELGYRVSLIGLDRNISRKEDFVYDGFYCTNLPYPKGASGWYEMLTSIKQYIPFIERNNPEIVIAYNHPAIALKRLFKFNQKKGIITLSDCTEWYEPWGNFIFKLVKGLDVNHRMYKVHCMLDGIITISRYLDDFYKSRGMKSLLLPPLVDKHEPKWQGKIENLGEELNLIYAGSPAGTKDRLDFMIEALENVSSHVKPFRFNIVGITEEEYRKVYLKGFKKTTPSFVSFGGRVPHEKVITMLRAADFQIFLRDDHLANRAGFPTKFAETISAGTIVLTNSSSNIKDYMIEGVNSFELDISSHENLVRTLSAPLSLSKDEITMRKVQIDTNMFDYRNYIVLTKHFLDSIYEKNS